jgi:hypothetical protein
MRYKLLNFVLGATIIAEDDEGNVLEKRNVEPVEAFSEAQAQELFTKVRDVIAELNNSVPPSDA